MSWEEIKNGWKSLKDKGSSVGWELFMTFSHTKSLLSSKRIERFALFISALTMCITYFLMHINTITVYEMLSISGALFLYAGFTLKTAEKEKLDKLTKKEDE